MNLGEFPPSHLLRDASLFLDFDGTLVAIVERPDLVVVGERLKLLLEELSDVLAGRVAILTGRSLADIDALLGMTSFAAGGSHGLEIRFHGGRCQAVPQPRSLDQVSVAMRRVERQFPGVLVERKPFGSALHFRRAPHAEQACLDLAGQLASQHDLTIQPGKMMIELRVPGGDKGGALQTLMTQPGWVGTTPIFIGDDLTDEPAFVAAREMDGVGILVGDPRPTSARYRLEDVPATLDWLEQAAGMLQ